MTSGRVSAAVGGFLLGSAFTIALSYLLFAKQKSKASTADDADGSRRAGLPATTRVDMKQRSAYAISSGVVERAGFMTEIMAQLWTYINVAGSEMVQEMVEPMFKDMLPGPLSTLHFTKCDLGKVPIRLDNVVVHEIKNGAVQFDLDVVWDGECEMLLQAKYGIAFGVKSVKLNGRMSFLLAPLTNQLPVVSAIQYAFINPPDLELDFTGLAQVADFKIIDKTIRTIIQDILASMVVLPNRMLYKMDAANDFFDTYRPPLGIARITAVKGRGFVLERKALRQHDVPDVYCNIQLGEKVWRTSTIKDSLTPEWNELADFVLSDHDQTISIQAWDEDRGALDGDDDLGSSKLTVGELLLAGKTMEIELERNDKETGAFITLHCDICVLTSDLGSLETSQGENLLCGLLTIVVKRACNIPVEKKKAASFVKVTYGTCEFVTGVVTDCPGYDALNPLYDCAFEVPLTAEMMKDGGGSVVFTLMNGVDSLGSTTVTHASLADTPDKSITERRKIGDQGASVEFRVSLYGINQTGESDTKPALRPTAGPRTIPTSLRPSVPSQPPVEKRVGTVRLTAVKGQGFKIEKRGFKKDDIPDVYCKIKFDSSPTEWKTATIKNNTSPEWNQSFEFPVFHHGQVVSINVFDEDRGRADSDDHLGRAQMTIGKLLLAGGMMDVELQSQGKGSGAFITLRCDLIDPAEGA